MKIICVETKEAQLQETFDGVAPTFRVLVPAHLIGPIRETRTGCEIQLSGGFPAVQSAESYDDILRKLNEMNKE